MRTGITCKKIPLLKSIEFEITLKESAIRCKYGAIRYKYGETKEQKYFLLPDHQLAENLILDFGSLKRTKNG